MRGRLWFALADSNQPLCTRGFLILRSRAVALLNALNDASLGSPALLFSAGDTQCL